MTIPYSVFPKVSCSSQVCTLCTTFLFLGDTEMLTHSGCRVRNRPKKQFHPSWWVYWSYSHGLLLGRSITERPTPAWVMSPGSCFPGVTPLCNFFAATPLKSPSSKTVDSSYNLLKGPHESCKLCELLSLIRVLGLLSFPLMSGGNVKIGRKDTPDSAFASTSSWC